MATNVDKGKNDFTKSSAKNGKRDCPNCGLAQPIRKRVCGGCNEEFVTKPKRKQNIAAMGKSNITEQRRILEKRANILHMHHQVDIVILMNSRHGRGTTVTCFGTEGAGLAFIGNKDSKMASPERDVVERLFTKFMQEYKKSIPKEKEHQSTSKGNVPNEQESRQHESPSGRDVAKEQKSQQHESQSGGDITNEQDSQQHESQSGGDITNDQDSRQSPSICSGGDASNQEEWQTSLSAATNVPQNLNSQPSMVMYYHNQIPVAGGIPHPNRTLLHGHPIPLEFTCVMLTVCQPNIQVPVVIGDVDENRFLQKNNFFALPNNSLMTVFQDGEKGLKMIPYGAR